MVVLEKQLVIGKLLATEKTLRELESDETMLVQSGKPVAVFKTHEEAPRINFKFSISA